MILTEEGGVIKTETGTVQLKWLWPKNGGKLKDPVDFQLNKEMNVRVLGKYAVNLFFSSNRESVKIPVGAMQGVAVPQGLHKVSSVSSRVDRASATETVASASIPGLVKSKPIKIGIHSSQISA